MHFESLGIPSPSKELFLIFSLVDLSSASEIHYESTFMLLGVIHCLCITLLWCSQPFNILLIYFNCVFVEGVLSG